MTLRKRILNFLERHGFVRTVYRSIVVDDTSAFMPGMVITVSGQRGKWRVLRITPKKYTYSFVMSPDELEYNPTALIDGMKESMGVSTTAIIDGIKKSMGVSDDTQQSKNG